MAAKTEQDQLINQARLQLSAPEVVFEELKKQAQRSRSEWYSYDYKSIEPMLLERNAPLINLGLACFGASSEVFQALYKHSLTQPENETDAIYKNGLRVGCLSNQVVAKMHMDFPVQLIGAEEMQRIISRGEDAEATAIMRNPNVSDRLLEALYLRSGPFASLPEERWLKLIIASARNERLRTKDDSDVGPDMGHYGIHQAIFRLLETAPVKPVWLRTLYDLLINLDFRHVAHPENLDSALSRWAAMPDKTKDGKSFEGYYTNEELKDEFRCLIAALYGRGFRKSRMILHGSANARDIALRCAFYGKGELTKKEMEAGYKRDGGVYLLAATFNERVYSHWELRKVFEDQIGFSDLEPKYQNNLKLINPTASSMAMPREKSRVSPMVALGYAWRILINILYIAVVLYVFDKLQGHSEAIITVAVLGLIYVTIRSMAIGQGIGLTSGLKVIESDLIRLRELACDEHARERWDASKAEAEVLNRARNKLLIDAFFLTIVSIICLVVLFGELGK
jgi:hypothetical protein